MRPSSFTIARAAPSLPSHTRPPIYSSSSSSAALSTIQHNSNNNSDSTISDETHSRANKRVIY